MSDIKPLSKPTKVQLTQMLRGTALTASAADALLLAADVVSEGATAATDASASYSGSTLVSIELARRFAFTDRQELETVARLAERSIFLHLGLLRLARREAERRCAPHLVREMDAETSFRIDDTRLLVDIDIECPLAVLDEMEGER